MKESREERRKYPRITPKNWLVACIDSSKEIVVGTVIDISKGGISFQYVRDIYNCNLTNGEKYYTLDLVDPSKELIVQRIPCKVVYDLPLKQEHPISFLRMKRCGIMFYHDEEKIKEIEELLRQVE